jgi:glycosyltransferase involved in cell wall biosynthesis
MTQPIRLLVLSNIMAPYRVALFNEVACRKNVELHVAYLAESESNRAWQVERASLRYPYTVLPGLHWEVRRDKTVHISWGVRRLFQETRPDVVMLGTDLVGSTASWAAIRLARRRGIPLVRYEARHAAADGGSGLAKAWYARLLKRADRFFAYSPMTRDYLVRDFGIAADKIDVGYNVGDSRAFVERVESARRAPSFAVQRRGYSPVTLLFVGQLDERKNIVGLLRACREIDAQLDSPVDLLVAGDGPLKEMVLQEAAGLQKVRLRLLGFVQSSALAKYYALADIFVLPSLSDPASIALSEALHSGLFVIASNRDGSSALVQDGINGLIVDPYDAAALGRAVQLAVAIVQLGDRNLRRQAIMHSVAPYTLEQYATRLVDSANKAVRATPP